MSAAFLPQNFGVIDLRNHFAVYSPTGGGLLDGLHGVAIVQGVTKIEVVLFFQIGSNPASSLNLIFSRALYYWA